MSVILVKVGQIEWERLSEDLIGSEIHMTEIRHLQCRRGVSFKRR